LIIVLIPLYYVSSFNLKFTVVYSLSILTIIVWDEVSPRLFKFKFSIQRVLFLNLVSLYGAVVFYFIVIAFRFLTPPLALLVSITTVPFVRAMVFITFANKKGIITHTLAISFSIFFSVYILVLAPSYDIFIAPILLSSIVYSLSAYLFVRLTISNFIKEFSANPLKILSEIVNSVTSDISYNVVLKNFFEDMYKTLAPREVSFIRMKTGDQAFTMVFPYVHPGPIGELGSSNITGKLQRKHVDQNLLVFHTTTTHDDNCAGDSEIEKISKVLNEKGKEVSFCYEPYLGEFVTFLPLGDGGIFFLSPDQPRFDDVKLVEGRKIVRKARSLGLKWAVAVDQHNNNMDEPRELDDVSYLMNEVEHAVRGRKNRKAIYVAYDRVTPELKDLGPGGISFVSASLGSKKLAIILFDGNNMEFELRKKIEASLEGYDKILICTTDNHVVNTRGLKVNPVGRTSGHEVLVDYVKNLEKRVQDKKEASIEYVKRDIWLKVAGENQWEKINKVIRNSTNRAKVLSATAIIFSIALSLMIFKILN
jgi:putative membrane protein